MTTPICPKCGATLPAPGATCPRCLLDLALDQPASSGEPAVTTHPRRPRTPPPTPAELAPLFPELEIEGLLGEGGMGAVYKARQKRLGREVALKVLHPDLSSDPVFTERFLREAQAMARLAHPGIITVHDFGERGGRCWLVMEFVDGTNLRALLKRGLLDSRQALTIVCRLCEALQFAHDEGVVHRDIKPENVLVDRKGGVKLADFGLAKLSGDPARAALTDAGQVMGTPHYMAPEQIDRPRDVDHRADIYSLGVVFYEMLTGELPLGRFAPPSQRVQVDVRLDEIVLRTLEHERERRYQHIVEVKTDVETLGSRPATPTAAPAATSPATQPEEPAPLAKGVLIGVVGRLRRPNGERPARPAGNWVVHVSGPVAWLLVFAGAWVLAGLAFNAGPFWFTLTALFLGCLFLALGEALRSPEGRAAWVALPRLRRLERWAASVLLLLFGALGLFAAHVASWERGTKHYVSNEQTQGALLDGARDLLIAESMTPQPFEVQIERSYSTSNPFAPFGLPPLIEAGLSVLLLWIALRALDGRRFDRASGVRSWRGAAHALTLALLPLLPWDYSQLMKNERTSVRVAASASFVDLDDSVEDVAPRVYAAFVQRLLLVEKQVFVRVVAPGDAKVRATGQLLAAERPAVFDRWHLRWSGPERLEPYVQAIILGGEGAQPTTVRLDAGMVDPGSPRRGEWERWIGGLLAELRRNP